MNKEKANTVSNLLVIGSSIFVIISSMLSYNMSTKSIEKSKRGIIEKVGYVRYLELMGECAGKAEVSTFKSNWR